MRRHIVGGRRAATIAASVLTTVGSVLPVTAVTAAATMRDAGSGCARGVRGDINALQPRDVAGACVPSAAAAVRGGTLHVPGTAATTCMTVPGVNDRCPQVVTHPDNQGFPILVSGPGHDGRLYQVAEHYNPDTLVVDAFDPGGHQLWSNVRRGVTYTPTGSTTPTSGLINPVAAATSPDGARLYVMAVMTIASPAGAYNCGWEGLLIAYRTSNGEAMWAANDDRVSRACSEFWTSLAVDSKRVYVTGGSTVTPDANAGETAAYDALNGAPLWWVSTSDLGGYSGSTPPNLGYGGLSDYANPIIEESADGGMILLLSYVEDPDQHLLKRAYQETTALNSGTGATQWSWRADLCPSCTDESHLSPQLLPLLAAVDDAHLYFTTVVYTPQLSNPVFTAGTTVTSAMSLVTQDVRTGHSGWTINLSAAGFGAAWIAADPTTSMVYVYGGGDGADAYALSAYRTADGSQAWSTDMTAAALGGDLSAGYNMSFVADGSQIFVAATVVPAWTQQGELLSMDAQTGGVSWRAWLDASVVDEGNVPLEVEPMALAIDNGLVVVAANESTTGGCGTQCPSYALLGYSAS